MGDSVAVAALRASIGAVAAVLRGRRHPRWRKFLRETWGRPRVVSRGRPTIWIVCAAGGELVQAHALGPALREAMPGATLVVSTSNHAFLDVAGHIAGLDARFYTPWDLRGPVRRALRVIAPDVLIAVESAWNPVLLAEARRGGARTMLASGTMVADYHRAEPYRRPMRLRVLEQLDLVGVKDENEAAAFERLEVPRTRIRVLGDLRLDASFHVVSPAEQDALRARAGLRAGDRVLVAGSVHAGEDTLVLDAARVLAGQVEGFRLVIAPRYLAAVPAVERACAGRGLRAVRFTRASPAREDAAVVILDTYGDLPRLYSLARWVVLGGSIVEIGLGLGQNLVEPLAQGVPVFFGPYMRRWSGVTRGLIDIFPGLAIRGANDLVAGIQALERDAARVEALRRYARELAARGADSAAHHAAAVQALLAVPALSPSPVKVR